MRLSIFNSSWRLLAGILLIALTGVVICECLYRQAGIRPNIRKKDIYALAKHYPVLIVGDSRGDAGVVPSILDGILKEGPTGNIADSGRSPINQIQLLKIMDIKPKLVIATVTPAGVYGTFYIKPEWVRNNYKHYLRGPKLEKIIKHPSRYSERSLSGIFRKRFAFAEGFQNFQPLITGTPSGSYRSKTGWLEVNPYGEKETFMRMVNIRAYKNLALKHQPGVRAKRDKIFLKALHRLGPGVKVILVRMPCDPQIRAIEDKKFPDFDTHMYALAKLIKVPYHPSVSGFHFDWVGSDGSHLTGPAAMDYTRRLGKLLLEDEIRANRNNSSTDSAGSTSVLESAG